MCSVTGEESLFGEIIHLDCRGLWQTSVKRASRLILCNRQSVICLRTIDHCDTSLLGTSIFSHAFMTHCDVQFCPCTWEKPSIVPLPLAAHVATADRDIWQQNSVMSFICLWAQTRVFNRLSFWLFNITYSRLPRVLHNVWSWLGLEHTPV